MTEAMSESANNQNEMLRALNGMASVHDFQEWLPANSPAILRDERTLGAIRLAEHACVWKQWHAAAELYVMAVVLFGAGDATLTPLEISSAANQIVASIRRSDPEIAKSGDFIVYCLEQASDCLCKDGVRPPEDERWLCEMLTSVLIRLETPIDVLQSLDLLARDTSPSRRPLVSFVRATLAHAADVYQRHTANGAARTMAERKNIQCLVWWCVAILVDSIMLRDLFRFPMVSTLFDGPNILGAALIGWFQLLILTWFFARWEARRTETDSIVSPLSFHASGANHDQSRVHCGEIMPFYRDWFFHAFQFVWICFAVSIFWFFDTYSELPAQIRTAWRGAGDAGSLSGFLRTIEPHFCWCSNAVETAGWLRVLATSDLTAIFVGIFAMLFATFNQNRISNQRVASGVNIYWWDRRISYSEWLVRLIMVALDAGLGFFLLAKVFMVSVVVYGAIELSVPYMDYFSLDGIAGMKFVTDIFQWISWFALLFGLLVIASIYLHRNLREYRLSDRFQLVIFACLVAAIAAPLFVLELHIASIRNDILAALSRSLPALNRTNLTDVAKYIKDIQTVREWPVSAISVGVQKGVVYLLISQVVVAVGQEFFGLFKAKLKGEVAKPDSGSSASHPSS